MGVFFVIVSLAVLAVWEEKISTKSNVKEVNVAIEICHKTSINLGLNLKTSDAKNLPLGTLNGKAKIKGTMIYWIGTDLEVSCKVYGKFIESFVVNNEDLTEKVKREERK